MVFCIFSNSKKTLKESIDNTVCQSKQACMWVVLLPPDAATTHTAPLPSQMLALSPARRRTSEFLRCGGRHGMGVVRSR